MEISKIEARTGYLFVKFSGEFELHPALIQFKVVAAECVRQGCPFALFDARDLTGDIGILARHTMGESLGDLRDQIRRLAILVRAEQVLPDRFMQTVARNRGFFGEAFFELSEAEAWLHGGADS